MRQVAPRRPRSAWTSPHPLCFSWLATLALATACTAPPRAETGPRYVDPTEVDMGEGTVLGSFDFHAATAGVVADLRAAIGESQLGRPWRVWLVPAENFSADRFDPELLADLVARNLHRDAQGFAEVLRPDAEQLARALNREQREGVRSGELPPTSNLMPDFVLSTSVRALERNPRAGISRWYVITYRLSDLAGVQCWSNTFELKKREERPIAYQ